MTTAPIVCSAAIVDATGIRGAALRTTWHALGQDPGGGRIRFPVAFATPFPGFRRLDPLSQALLIAVEAAGLEAHLPDGARRDTALVFGSATGCLAADRRFAASLGRPKGIEPAVFPYTLPSTCLGEIAIRHRLQGPTLSISLGVSPDGSPDVSLGTDAAGEAVDAAARLLDGDAAAALLLLGDWIAGDPDPARRRVAALLLQRPTGARRPGPTTFDDLRTDPWRGLEAIVSGDPEA